MFTLVKKQSNLKFNLQFVAKRVLITSALIVLALITIYFCQNSCAYAADIGNSDGAIVFYTDRDGDYEIYAMSPDGSQQTNICNLPGSQERDPSFSSDGKFVVFDSTIDAITTREIYITNSNGKSWRRLTNNSSDDSQASFSKDGSKIVFTSMRDGNSEVYMMNSDGTGQTNLTNNTGSDSHPKLSPDGTKIVFHSNRDGNWDIYTMNIDGTDLTNLTLNDGPKDSQAPGFSNDGTKIVYASNHEAANMEIYTMNPDGTGKVRVTSNTSDDWAPCFSPDGSKIILQSLRDGDWEIYVINSADGSSPTRLTNDVGQDLVPSWGPAIIDATAPATALSTNPSSSDGANGWFATTPTITLTVGETATTYYSWTSSTGPWTEYSAPFTAPEGDNTLYYYSIDSADNNEVVKNQSIKVDTSEPSAVALSGNAVDSNRIDLAWSASEDTQSGIDHYEVRDALTDNLIATTTGTSYSFTDALTLNTYSFYVEAVNAAGVSSDQSNTLRTTCPPAWTQPLLIDIEPNNDSDSATIAFPRNVVPSSHFYGHISNSTDADYYQAYFYAGQTVDFNIDVESVGTEVGWTLILPDDTVVWDTAGLGTLSSSDHFTATTPMTGYHTMVVWNRNNSSTNCRYDIDVNVTPQSDTLSPTTPTGFTATAISSTEINLSWTASTDDIGPVGYGVVNLDTGEWLASTKSTSVNLTGLTPNTTYNFGLGAYDAGGNISSGVPASATTSSGDTVPPTAPGNLSWTSISTNSVTLSWSASTDNVGVSGYNVYNASTDALIDTATGTSCEITGLSAGSAYSFYVKAYDAANNLSAASNTLEVTIPSDSSSQLIPEGNSIEVSLPVSFPSGDTKTVTIKFDNITSSGTLDIEGTDKPPSSPPVGFMFLGDIYDITFTGSFSDYIYISLPYDPSIPDARANNLKLFHRTSTGWEDCTYSIDTENHTVTGRATSLSPFVLVGPVAAATGVNTYLLLVQAFLSICTGVFFIRRRPQHQIKF